MDTGAKSWLEDKNELLRTHLGSFVAYCEGKRIGPEDSLDHLVAAIHNELGPPPRKPCEFHEIIKHPPARRGPSPRLIPPHVKGRQ